MKILVRSNLATCFVLALLLGAVHRSLHSQARGDEPDRSPSTFDVSFAAQIRPLLSDKCFACHGPDEKTREADLRLDLRDVAVDRGVIVPGEPDQSELIRRISLASDDDEKMPPREFHKELTDQDLQLLREWVAAGAAYEQHWAYRPLQRPPVPQLGSAGSEPVDHPIDAFLLAALRQQEMEFADSADRVTLIRRLYLDLLGMPPTQSDVERFLDDSSPQAVRQAVDVLLSDTRFGERLAVFWLDLVRYADTIGYHSDNHMEVSSYRDYVIRSFNENKPFDQFTVEQLAGDLMANPSQEQLVASGYNRLLQTTEEGGAQAKEYMSIYAADRVRNLSGVWLGQTVGCAQCHDHKYDPITTKDFYSLAAFFADIDENAVGKRDPNFTIISPTQQGELDSLTNQVASLQIEARLAADPQLAGSLAEGQAAWEQSTLRVFEAQVSPGKSPTIESTEATGGVELPDEIASALKTSAQARSPEQIRAISDHYRTFSPELSDAKQQLVEAETQLKSFRDSLQTMLVSKSLAEPRVTRILPRGNWLDESGEVVQPTVPSFLPHQTIEGRRATRLDLAEWVVSDENPLTARAFVNRLWKLFYGRGLSRNLDDLGGQGEAPTHPRLLDWLAVEFRDSGWDVQHIVRLMVTSKSYAQSSIVSKDKRSKDPLNRLYGRQGRWRLEAEFVRDTALAISGLLAVDVIGGRSVKPYQPAGYWQHLNFPQREWQADSGSDLYRRGLYTFWCRTFLHPSMFAFDAPTREECTAERSRSNIPQQALVLLNDPVFVEASRMFAARIMASGEDTDARLAWAVRSAMSREPQPKELAVLRSLLTDQRSRYTEAPDDARALLKVGVAEVSGVHDPGELAAWTQVARAILNAYETTSRF